MRWGTILFNAESLLYNKKALKRLAITDGVILRHDIQIRILDDDFWCGLLSLHEIIAPVVKWTTILEGDYCTISLVPKAYFEIKNVFKERLPQSPISVEEGKRIENILEKRAEILIMPASTAATERTFSKYGNIQNNKRNRLKTERAGKLVYLSHNLKLDKEPKNCERKEEKYKEKRLMFFTPCGTKKYLLKLNQLLKTSKMISGSITLTIIT